MQEPIIWPAKHAHSVLLFNTWLSHGITKCADPQTVDEVFGCRETLSKIRLALEIPVVVNHTGPG